MNYKWIGALLIIAGCGGWGFMIAASHRQEERSLRQLVSALDLMECELQYRLTPLPELCRQAGQENKGAVRAVLLELAEELEARIAPDVSGCMDVALAAVRDMPGKTREAFKMMGHSLGRFDMNGQLKGLEAVRVFCRRELDGLTKNADVRLRSYQTLGFCAGAALVILFM